MNDREQVTPDPITIRLSRDQSTEDIEVRALEDSLFEILETPLLHGRVAYKDVVRLRRLENGAYRVVKIVRRPFQHFFPLVRTEYAYSRSIFEFYRWLESRGGEWEPAVGPLLFIHLPVGGASIDEVVAELNQHLDSFRKGGEG